jgi:isoleucyl-tRNA synthetase
MPYAQWHYPFENKDKIDQGDAFPADYISEAIDQTRGWFYTMLAVGTILKQAKVVKEPPYKNVLVLGLLHDAEGRKLSKSLRNYGSLDELFDKYGADALRWFMCQVNQPWDAKNFDPKTVEEGTRKTFLIAMNVLSFWEMYNKNVDDQAKATHPMDRWIEARTQSMVNDVTARLEKYDITGAARSLGDFVTDLSTWYVRRSRDRFKKSDLAAPAVLKRTLLTMAKLMAPFTPFIAEEIYHRAGGPMTSVHLETWPEQAATDQALLAEMTKVRGVVEVVHGLRAAAGIKVRQPLEQLAVTDEFPEAMMEILREELNLKEVRQAKTLPTGDDWRTTDEVALDIAISDQLREEGLVRDLVRELNALRKTAGLKPEDQIVIHCPANTLAAKLIEVYGATILRDARAKAATPTMDGATDKTELTLGEEKTKIGLSKV